MGVHGLWRLIEPSGKPVPLETLENKILAVDVSIWLHHFIKGFQDNRGASVPNAHLLGIYHRVCKLLYFKIKPVFVFDGGVPVLKKNTIAQRNQQKQKNLTEAERIHKNLLSALVKHSAISKVISEKAKAAITASTSPTKKAKVVEDDLYVLPPTQLDSTVSSDDESDVGNHPSRYFDLHSIDTESAEFKSLPVDVRHEILTDLKETRKQSSWGRIHELPTQSTDFATYQIRRLLKRQSVQSALEELEKEMGGNSLSLGELEKLLKDQGVITNLKGNRIASDENTRFLLIKDIKQAMEDAKKQNLDTIQEEKKWELVEKSKIKDDEEQNVSELVEITKNKGDRELENDLKRAIALSLEETPSTSKTEKVVNEASTSKVVKKIGEKGKNRMPLSFLSDFEDTDFDESESSDEEFLQTRLTPAQSYMIEYSGLTSHAISKIITGKRNEEKTDVPDSEMAKTVSEEQKLDFEKKPKEKDCTPEIVNEIEKKNSSITEKADVVQEQECKVSTTFNIEESKEDVEVMSNSGSSSCEDFVDVEDNKEKAMEVIIKPDEELQDDLFSDIFQETTSEMKVPSFQDNIIKNINEFVTISVENKGTKETVILENFESDKDNKFKLASEKEEENKRKMLDSVSYFKKPSLGEKINKMVKDYTALKENESALDSESKSKEETPKVSLEQLNEMQTNLRNEQNELVAAKSLKERLAGNITEQMCQEAQELLELFGVPYIVAPMEAEAQCAFLDLINLTDGTITDDSDIWLFGGRTVYKNFFDQNKLVMEYKAESIQQNYKLTREQMILLAMLVGSDYTTGLNGVGPVTALEILAAFPPKSQLISGLAEFKNWFKKGKLPGPGRTVLRGKLKNVTFTETFPNPQVVQAYLEPTVETSTEKFSWAKPDIIGLIDYAKQKFGWSKEKSEEILNPILRRMEEKHSQKKLTEFFKYEHKTDTDKAEKHMSKRVKTAIHRIAKGVVEDDEAEIETKKEKVPRKKRSNPDEGVKAKRKKVNSKVETDDEDSKILKNTITKSITRVEEIHEEVQKQIDQQNEKKIDLERFHKKEVIPQRLKDKSDMLKNKLKAIETFRKSKQGPGYVKKRGKKVREPKKDASYLSESSNSD